MEGYDEGYKEREHWNDLSYISMYHAFLWHLFCLDVHKENYERTNEKHSNKNLKPVHTCTATAGWQKGRNTLFLLGISTDLFTLANRFMIHGRVAEIYFQQLNHASLGYLKE